MKKILKEMVELMKIGRHTDCGGELDEEQCAGCKEYFVCLNNYRQTEKCEKLISQIELLED